MIRPGSEIRLSKNIIVDSCRTGCSNGSQIRKRKAIRSAVSAVPPRKMTNVNKSLGPFAQRYITSMKYSQTFTISSALGAVQRFNLNNIYDPDRTGVGHQPYGYDQLGAIYNRYRVIACHWAINVYPSTGTAPVRVAALPSNEEVTNTTLSDACEDPRAKWMVQVPGATARVLKGKVYLPSLLGRTPTEYRGSQGATLERSSRRQCCAQYLCPGNE